MRLGVILTITLTCGLKACASSVLAAPLPALCQVIQHSLSNASGVFYPSSPEYVVDLAHWSLTNTAPSTCSVEPGTTEDVSTLMRILASARAPFAVKGGGHSANPGFSSTTGVQIALKRFTTLSINNSASTVDIGPGLLWADVYTGLSAQGLNVVGGRLSQVGVPGLVLGGGFSWLSNEHGLAVDNVKAFELVLPNGQIKTITQADEDLWFALRGGLNNFGIVTKITLKTFPSGQVWGGLYIVSANQSTEFAEVISKLTTVTDPKLAINAANIYGATGFTPAALIFYDAASPPAGIFDELFALPALVNTVQTLATFSDFVQALVPTEPAPGLRAAYSAAPVLQYSPALLEVLANETSFWGAHFLSLDANASVTIVAEPFISSAFSHGADSAFPPDRSRVICPTNLYFSWSKASLDDEARAAIAQSSRTIRAAAIAEGQDVANAAMYPNYALGNTPLEDMYGKNVPRLKAIRTKYDPKGTMLLTGGFKFV
ncbi:FAD-binding domain-containing protein [Auriscalpium vulgare]|uniref:FAD-binding domain-containing protein n=1 Tax=Auriscalpium vulgare TaxID=40419 RepID=A0ACB8S7C9_9AGAM|nr:FAD-binding domain-containing protein [Auriscalpium vulgare]